MKIHLPTLKLLNKTKEVCWARSLMQGLVVFYFSKVPNPQGDDTTEGIYSIFCIQFLVFKLINSRINQLFLVDKYTVYFVLFTLFSSIYPFNIYFLITAFRVNLHRMSNMMFTFIRSRALIFVLQCFTRHIEVMQKGFLQEEGSGMKPQCNRRFKGQMKTPRGGKVGKRVGEGQHLVIPTFKG